MKCKKEIIDLFQKEIQEKLKNKEDLTFIELCLCTKEQRREHYNIVNTETPPDDYDFIWLDNAQEYYLVQYYAARITKYQNEGWNYDVNVIDNGYEELLTHKSGRKILTRETLNESDDKYGRGLLFFDKLVDGEYVIDYDNPIDMPTNNDFIILARSKGYKLIRKKMDKIQRNDNK